MTRDEAAQYARDWAEQWNRRDLAAVLAHFADDVVFTSPRAAAVIGQGTVAGKAALRAYWELALSRIGALRFELRRVVWDPEARELVILYDRVADGARDRAAEILAFGGDGLVVRGEVLHGLTPAA